MPSPIEMIDRDEQIDCNERPSIDDRGPPDRTDEHDDGDGGDGKPIRWVEVASFWSVDQAHLARLRLEAQDIPCLMDNANLVAMNWMFANAVGGVKLRVPEEDAADAREILGTSRRELERELDVHDEDDEATRCPACGSTDVYRARLSRRAFFLSWLLLGIPLPFLSNKLRCSRCGEEWRREPRGFPVR